MSTPPAEPAEPRLVLSSRAHLKPEAAREVIVPAAPASAPVAAPKLEMPAEVPDIEEPGVPLESKPDFLITSRLDVGWRLVAILLLAAAPLLFMLGDARTGLTEQRTLTATTAAYDRQTLFDANPYAPERLAPVEGGQVRAENPPGTTWAHLTATLGLRHADASIADLRQRARLTSVLAGLFTVLMVFWCGYSIGGMSTATYAGMIAGALPGLVWFMRQARPEPLQTAAATFAMATALWAIRPLRDPAHFGRQALGWSCAGLGLGAAMLCGGTAAAPPLLLTLFLVVMVCPHRLGHTLGLLAAICIAALTLVPWVLVAVQLNPEMMQIWLARVLPSAPADGWSGFWPAAGALGLLVLIALGPWLLWLPASLLQPFSTSSTGVRQRMMIGWSWFMAAALMVVLSPLASHEVGAGAMLMALPPAAILLGQLMRRFADLAAAGHLARFWRSTRALMVVVTLALPLLLPAAAWWLQHHPMAMDLPDALSALLQAEPLQLLIGCIPMLVAALVGAVFAAGSLPGPATACWMLWTTIAMLMTLPSALR